MFFLFDSHSLVDQIEKFVAGWKVSGYLKHKNWWDSDNHYRVFLSNGKTYHHVSLEIDPNKERRYFIESSGFDPYWFRSMDGQDWVWLSEEHRLGALRIAQNNREARDKNVSLPIIKYFH